MTAKKPEIVGTDEQLMAAARLCFVALGAMPHGQYAERCQDKVAVGLCGSGTRGLDPGRYPCANPAQPGEPYCVGPCQTLVAFSG